jgi:hypothetical protein
MLVAAATTAKGDNIHTSSLPYNVINCSVRRRINVNNTDVERNRPHHHALPNISIQAGFAKLYAIWQTCRDLPNFTYISKPTFFFIALALFHPARGVKLNKPRELESNSLAQRATAISPARPTRDPPEHSRPAAPHPNASHAHCRRRTPTQPLTPDSVASLRPAHQSPNEPRPPRTPRDRPPAPAPLARPGAAPPAA